MFETLDHKGEIGVVGKGTTIEKAFEESAKGMFSVMVSLEDVKAKERIKVEAEAGTLDELLVQYLNELLYLLEVNKMFFSEFEVEKIFEEKERFQLKGFASGEKIDEKKHRLGIEVKAASYSGLSVKNLGKEFSVQCVLDV